MMHFKNVSYIIIFSRPLARNWHNIQSKVPVSKTPTYPPTKAMGNAVIASSI